MDSAPLDRAESRTAESGRAPLVDILTGGGCEEEPPPFCRRVNSICSLRMAFGRKELDRVDIPWVKGETFDPAWKLRIECMAKYLSDARSVVDHGSGMEWLRAFLSPDVSYFPCDYTRRSSATIVCNYNNWEFPNVVADAAFVSGCLEYVRSPEWFVEQLSTHADSVVLSYCTLDENPHIAKRRRLNWVNDLSESELVNMCRSFGLELVVVDRSVEKNPIFVLRRTRSLGSWGVLSYRGSPSGDMHNLGDYFQAMAAAALAGFEIADAPTVDRERLSGYAGRNLKLVLNGWFSHSRDALPAASALEVKVVSFHLAEANFGEEESTEIARWLTGVGPIGCRDSRTLDWARRHDVPAYLSKCITPLVGTAFAGRKRTEDAVIVDPWLPPRRRRSTVLSAVRATVLDPLLVFRVYRKTVRRFSMRVLFDSAVFVGVYRKFLSRSLIWNAKWRSHMFSRSSFSTEESIRRYAVDTLEAYAEASMVITTRIHAALPCYGMGTPVLFVHGNDGDGRYYGLIDRFARIRLDIDGEPNPDDVYSISRSGTVSEPIVPPNIFGGAEESELRHALDHYLERRHSHQ